MMQNGRKLVRGGALLAALAVAIGLWAPFGGRAEAQTNVDISGHWTIAGLDLFSDDCPTVIIQAGTLLAAAAECGGNWHLRGTIDPATAEFSLSGSSKAFLRAVLEGTASEDGNSISGVSSMFSRSFDLAGTRKDGTLEGISLSGNWDLVFAGDISETCMAAVRHAEGGLSLDLDCGETGWGSLIGAIDHSTGRFALSGTLFGADADVEGTASLSGRAIGAVWNVASVGFGTFTGYLEERKGGVLAVDCDAALDGVQASCTYETGTTFDAELHVTEAPPEGYTGFEMHLRWTVPQFSYLPAPDQRQEVIQEHCDLAERANQWDREPQVPVVVFLCLSDPGSAAQSTFTGAVVQFQMQCAAAGSGTLALDAPKESLRQRSLLYDGTLGSSTTPLTPITPIVSNANIWCEPSTTPPDETAGDANCNGLVSSIDALLVLQFEAGLITSLACERNADVNEDNVISSIDAALILQFDAGLKRSLPPPKAERQG